MFCHNCGASIPDAANFCSNFGKSQRPVPPEPIQEPKYETCQVNEWVLASGTYERVSRFIVDAVGPEGKYIVYGSEALEWETGSPGSFDKYRPVVDSIVDSLIQNGWEPLSTNGPKGSNYRFRRPLPAALEFCEITYKTIKKSGFLKQGTYSFEARASGPGGSWLQGESEPFSKDQVTLWNKYIVGNLVPNTDKGTEVERAYMTLKKKLLAQGWREVGSGSAWWNAKFRRPVR